MMSSDEDNYIDEVKRNWHAVCIDTLVSAMMAHVIRVQPDSAPNWETLEDCIRNVLSWPKMSMRAIDATYASPEDALKPGELDADAYATPQDVYEALSSIRDEVARSSRHKEEPIYGSLPSRSDDGDTYSLTTASSMADSVSIAGTTAETMSLASDITHLDFDEQIGDEHEEMESDHQTFNAEDLPLRTAETPERLVPQQCSFPEHEALEKALAIATCCPIPNLDTCSVTSFSYDTASLAEAEQRDHSTWTAEEYATATKMEHLLLQQKTLPRDELKILVALYQECQSVHERSFGAKHITSFGHYLEALLILGGHIQRKLQTKDRLLQAAACLRHTYKHYREKPENIDQRLFVLSKKTSTLQEAKKNPGGAHVTIFLPSAALLTCQVMIEMKRSGLKTSTISAREKELAQDKKPQETYKHALTFLHALQETVHPSHGVWSFMEVYLPKKLRKPLALDRQMALSDGGDTRATIVLGHHYANKNDLKRARDCFRRALAMGSLEAGIHLSNILYPLSHAKSSSTFGTLRRKLSKQPAHADTSGTEGKVVAYLLNAFMLAYVNPKCRLPNGFPVKATAQAYFGSKKFQAITTHPSKKITTCVQQFFHSVFTTADSATISYEKQLKALIDHVKGLSWVGMSRFIDHMMALRTARKTDSGKYPPEKEKKPAKKKEKSSTTTPSAADWVSDFSATSGGEISTPVRPGAPPTLGRKEAESIAKLLGLSAEDVTPAHEEDDELSAEVASSSTAPHHTHRRTSSVMVASSRRTPGFVPQ
ncbi:MAG: hypothetical protein DHS20C10_12620 [marine bacterium B5-7]|nr:MAG: hypothetical protein DHS20C10_12620 [marine bacterium B5-7]